MVSNYPSYVPLHYQALTYLEEVGCKRTYTCVKFNNYTSYGPLHFPNSLNYLDLEFIPFFTSFRKLQKRKRGRLHG